ncbi:MAG: sigma-70 family RNA polymerase sigma factor [bacterium]
MDKKKTYTDIELLNLTSGDEENFRFAFDEIYARYSKQVYSYCNGMLNNRFLAEDVFQETFAGFFIKVRNRHDIDNILAFLIGIARNHCRNQIRNRKLTLPLDMESLIVDERSHAEKNELFDLVVSSLALLDEKYREVFILKEFEGLTNEEVSNICGLTKEGVRSRLHRAFIKIREILAPYLEDLSSTNIENKMKDKHHGI